MIAVDAVKRTILLVNRFGLYLFIPAFLIIAYSYTSSTFPQYRVTAKIALKSASGVSAINDIKSKNMVQKALNQLPFQASYYHTGSPKNEIYGDSLYLRLVFDNNSYADNETWIGLEASGANFVTLTHEDTTAYDEFNKPVSESYGKFKVVHGPGNRYMQASYMVRLEDPVKLLDQYYNSLQLKTADNDNTITISILCGNSKKGADFINKLLQLYDGGHHAIPSYRLTSTGGAVISNKKFDVLEMPENNAEPASLSSFWIYTIALLMGLVIPLNRQIIGNFKGYISPAYLFFKRPKLANRLHHRFAVKQ